MGIVIVGGGVVGLAAAILLKKQNEEVYLIERDKQLGGLLNSIQMSDGMFLDFGSHVPRETEIDELDNILFKNLPLEEWNKYSYANVGNFFQGKLNYHSQFIDVSILPVATYLNGLKDLLSIEDNLVIDNAEESLKFQFGNTFAKEVYKPLLNKLFGVRDLNQLEPNSHNLFGYSRMIVANQEMTEKFKTVSFLDERVAHIKNSIGASTKSNYYPKSPGIYKWIEHLKKQALQLGVTVITEDYITELDSVKKSVLTNKGKKLAYDKLVWTLPKEMLFMLMEKKLTVELPEFRGVNIVHFKYEGQLLTENHYVYCNDSTLKSFRVTLYDNLTNERTSWCSVEVIGEKCKDVSVLFEELKIMGIIDTYTKCTDVHEIYIKNGFPIPKRKATGVNTEALIPISVVDIITLNRDANNFFMEDLLVKMYKKLSSENMI